MAKNERSILEGLNFGAPAPAAEPVPQPAQPEPELVKKAEKPAKKAAKPEKKAAEKQAEKPAEKPAEQGSAAPTEQASIRSTYVASFKEKKRETRSVRTTISLTPRVYEHLTRATEAGDIKSANDLINYLLEQYFEG